MVMLTGMCLCLVEFSTIAHFVLYVKNELLFTVVTAGFFLAILEIGGAFGKPIAGLISDRLFHGARRNVYLLMCGVTFIACIALSFLQQGSPSWIIIPLSFILGFTGGGWGGVHLTLVGEFAGRELAGLVAGLAAVVALIGNIIGPPLFGYIIDTTGSYRTGWQLLAGVALVGVVLLLFVREGKRRI
jgi:MFS family permease